MAEFAPGMRVIIRDEEWMIKKCDINSYGHTVLQCIGVSSLVKDKPAFFLDDLESIEIIDPAQTKLVIDSSSHYDRSRLYFESLWRQKIPTDRHLHIGHKAVMNVVPYQLEPAQMSLNRPKQRILIADAVGLGKTLEAGILMSELIARGKGQRILVVTVKSMMTQFQKEMWERFTIPLISLDSAAIHRIRHEIPTNHNPFHYYDKTIVSIDTIKRDDEYRTYLENAWWDIIVIDEAHNVARRGSRTQRSSLAENLSRRSDTLIMLSATPHDGNARSFASLMNMLDPTAIPNPDDYTEKDIKDSGSDLKGLFVRRFKKDIQDQTSGKFMQRHVAEESCQASPYEEAALDCFVDYERDLIGEDGSHLKTMTFKKAMFSSPAACMKSIEARKRRIREDLSDKAARERMALDRLYQALSRIAPEDFSRYRKLLSLLRSTAYAWDPKAADDRLVIFTERIETMRYLIEHLKKDLKLPLNAVQELHGGMSDLEQQRIVEEFGRTESPIRILVASDVASEGINLHYLSHRLIHFDIPWSLMVFQQRNGRIDRYGQTKEPDIRYMVIKTDNEKIRGDMRILEILIRKEDQAAKNIGDPALLMKVYDIDKEEERTAEAMDRGDADAFEEELDSAGEEDIFKFFETMEDEAPEEDHRVKTVEDHTLFSDMDYLRMTLSELSRTKHYSVSPLDTVEGLEIEITDDMRRRWRNVLPSEAIPSNGFLRLSPDRDFCAQANARSLQNVLSENAWPTVQYLWKQHPVMQWANDKAAQFFGRREAPLIGIDKPGQHIFCVAALIPNRRGTPLIDEWFALRYRNGAFVELLTMEQLIKETGFSSAGFTNLGDIGESALTAAEALRADVVQRVREEMTKSCKAYSAATDPQIDHELDKLAELEKRHMDRLNLKYEQLSMFGAEQRKEREQRKIDEQFNRFINWVQDSMTIQNNPYIRIIAVFTGVKA